MTNKIIKTILDKYNLSNDFDAKQIGIFYKLFESIKESIVISEINFCDSESKIVSVEVLCEYSATQSGNYKFMLPYIAELFNPFAALLGLQFIGVEDKSEVLQTIEVSSEIIGKINKAAKFVSKDNLRSDLPCVLLHFKDNSVKVVATDAHKLYMSESLACEYVGETKILINTNGLMNLAKHKAKGETVKLEFLQPIQTMQDIFEDYRYKGKGLVDTDIQFMYIDSVKVELLHNTQYVNYEVVMPQFETKMTFERKALIGLVKQILPATNKATSQINFHLNGNISAIGCDVDFGFESSSSIDYISKDFKDCDIAFNGKLLNECLSSFKDNTLNFYSNGKATQAALITNNVETILLMPLVTNN
jgi:DNA polymerase III sliding clamp (beta) subunit (PCNA family)